ncbi:MAG: hypothetical protein ACYS99_16805 [Planctomycetota bacterium]|jgi:hypothetical protein
MRFHAIVVVVLAGLCACGGEAQADSGPKAGDPEAPVAATLAGKTVSVDFESTPVLTAVRSVAKDLGLTVEVPEEIEKELENAPINLKLTDLEADAAMELMLRLAGPDYAFTEKDGVLTVHRR